MFLFFFCFYLFLHHCALSDARRSLSSCILFYCNSNHLAQQLAKFANIMQGFTPACALCISLQFFPPTSTAKESCFFFSFQTQGLFLRQLASRFLRASLRCVTYKKNCISLRYIFLYCTAVLRGISLHLVPHTNIATWHTNHTHAIHAIHLIAFTHTDTTTLPRSSILDFAGHFVHCCLQPSLISPPIALLSFLVSLTFPSFLLLFNFYFIIFTSNP
jgi:hypothetical protein